MLGCLPIWSFGSNISGGTVGYVVFVYVLQFPYMSFALNAYTVIWILQEVAFCAQQGTVDGYSKQFRSIGFFLSSGPHIIFFPNSF